MDEFELNEFFFQRLRMYTSAIRHENQKLKKAIQDGIYDPRSIVGDTFMNLEYHVNDIGELIDEYNK